MKINDKTYIHEEKESRITPKSIVSIIALIAMVYFMGETLVYAFLFHILPYSFFFYMGMKLGIKIGRRQRKE